MLWSITICSTEYLILVLSLISLDTSYQFWDSIWVYKKSNIVIVRGLSSVTKICTLLSHYLMPIKPKIARPSIAIIEASVKMNCNILLNSTSIKGTITIQQYIIKLTNHFPLQSLALHAIGQVNLTWPRLFTCCWCDVILREHAYWCNAADL